MEKEYNVKLTLDQMDIIIASLQYYAYRCKTENETELNTLRTAMEN